MIVKMCGMRTIEAAQTAVDAGADMLGFIFVHESKRFIEPGRAKKIIKNLKKRVDIVGVFKNQSLEFVQKLSNELDLDYVQLHGSETSDYTRSMTRPVIKTIFSDENVQNYSPAFYLLDRPQQGIGTVADTNMARNISQKYPVLFAGGLTPENVSDIIRAVRPLGVDVASGVEIDERHDLRKIITFIKNAKAVV